MDKKIKIITHDESFHADDVFACAVLSFWLEKKNKSFRIIRTRDEKIITSGDYIFDLGGVYDADKNRFDHHQIGGAGKRENGIPYAAFGLVWKKFGKELCHGFEEVKNKKEKKLVQPIDAQDNGIDIFKPIFENLRAYTIENITSAFQPTWKEKDGDIDGIFAGLVKIAKKILEREIIKASHLVEVEEILKKGYQKVNDKRFLVLDQKYHRQELEYILKDFPKELFFATCPTSLEEWKIITIPAKDGSFKRRKLFPGNWAGRRDKELAKITGVPDALFCHRGRFMAVTKSKKGAIKLVQLALED